MPLIELELEKDPSSPLYRWYRARDRAALGRLEDARVELRSVLGLDGSAREDAAKYGRTPFLGAISTFVQVVSDLGAEVDHENDLDVLLAEVPDHPALLLAKARAHASRRQPREAAQLALEAHAVLPEAKPEWGALRVAAITWQATELAAQQLMEAADYPAALQAYQACISARPDEQPGWSPILTNAAAISIELGQPQTTEVLLGRLLGRPECHPGMFYFELDRRLRTSGLEAAQRLWQLAAGASHLHGQPEYEAWKARLGFTAETPPAASAEPQ